MREYQENLNSADDTTTSTAWISSCGHFRHTDDENVASSLARSLNRSCVALNLSFATVLARKSSGARARGPEQRRARARGPEQRRARVRVGCHLGEELRVFALQHFLQNPGLGVWYCEELRVFALQHFLHNPG